MSACCQPEKLRCMGYLDSLITSHPWSTSENTQNANFALHDFCELHHNGVLRSSYPALCIAPVLCPNSATVAGVSFGVSWRPTFGGKHGAHAKKRAYRGCGEYRGIHPICGHGL